MPTTRPTSLLLVDDKFNVTEHRHRLNEPRPKGKPVPPIKLHRDLKKVWDRQVRIGFWLTAADSDMLLAYCILQLQLEKHVSEPGLKWTSCQQLEHRRSASELGFTPVGRARMGNNTKKQPHGKGKEFVERDGDEKETPASRHF